MIFYTTRQRKPEREFIITTHDLVRPKDTRCLRNESIAKKSISSDRFKIRDGKLNMKSRDPEG